MADIEFEVVPLRDQVQIERHKESMLRGLHIPGKADVYRVVVAAVGPEVTLVKPGDEVLVMPHQTASPIYDRDDTCLISEKAIAALVKRPTVETSWGSEEDFERAIRSKRNYAKYDADRVEIA